METQIGPLQIFDPLNGVEGVLGELAVLAVVICIEPQIIHDEHC